VYGKGQRGLFGASPKIEATNTPSPSEIEGNRELPDRKFGFDGSLVREAERIYGFGDLFRVCVGFRVRTLCCVAFLFF
jgi:hypothetical protein